MQDGYIDIKGVRDGLLIIIHPDSEWQAAIRELTERIDKQAGFFTGSRITVNLGNRPVPKAALASLKAALDRRNLPIAQVLTDSPTTYDAADALDLRVGQATSTPEPAPQEDTAAFHTQAYDPQEEATPGLLVPRTLRSGRTVRTEGHVVVIGDVNAGAEIVAGGDVIIWGVLRGMVHAGALGNRKALVCALEMAPTQLRIADLYSITPKERMLRWGARSRPEMARIDGDYIVVEPWQRTPRKDK
jgi:septum site-determining protein MinC